MLDAGEYTPQRAEVVIPAPLYPEAGEDTIQRVGPCLGGRGGERERVEFGEEQRIRHEGSLRWYILNVPEPRFACNSQGVP